MIRTAESRYVITADQCFDPILMDWKGFFAVALVLRILVLGIAELWVLFGIYYWLAASETERHMAKRASLTCTVLFFVMNLSSLGKILRYLALDLGFFELAAANRPYRRIGFFVGVRGVCMLKGAFLPSLRSCRCSFHVRPCRVGQLPDDEAIIADVEIECA